MNYSASELDYFKKHGILGGGFLGKHADAENFMSYVLDPSYETRISIDLRCGRIDLNDTEDWKTRDVCYSIFNKCVFLDFEFENFLKACRDLKSLDPWFMSTCFMSDVWAGGIRGKWSILCQYENSDKEPYRNRFRRFVQSLDDRGMKWTEKYLEPDRFWGQKKAYWSEQ